jgi:hypothetical protein
MDLFEYLLKCIGCTFISDLKFGIYRDEAINILNSMDKTNIDHQQIADASKYFGIVL